MSQTKAQLISDLVQALNFTGTASAPANGAFLSAANTLALATNSAQRLTIDSSGNVGIGTTSPARLLHQHVSSSAANYHSFTNDTTGSGSSDGLLLGINLNEEAIFWNYENTDMRFATNGTDRLIIDNSGKVGIGTTSPAALLHLKSSSADCDLQVESTGSATDARLNLYGRSNGVSQIRFGDEDDTNVGLLTYDHTGNYMLFRTADAERMRIDSSGRVLIGTTSILHSQSNKLYVAGTDSSTSISLNRYADSIYAPYIHFRKSRSGTVGGNTIVQDDDLLGRIYFEGNDGSSPVSAAYIEAHVDGTPGNQDMPGRLEFLTTADGTPTPVERMRIDSAGRLLIGTTTEGHPAADDFTIANTASGADMGITLRSATNGQGAIYFSDGTSGDDEYRGIINYNHSSNFFSFFTNATERMRINTSGHVGIGTTSPTAPLHVVNSASSTDAIISNSGNDSRLHIIAGTNQKNSILRFGDPDDDNRGAIDYDHNGDSLAFRIAGVADRLLFNSQGYAAFNATVPNGNAFLMDNNSSTNPEGLYLRFSFAAPNTSARHFLKCTDNVGDKAVIDSNGNSRNLNNSYAGFSDISLKENIVDANSQWDDIKNVRVRVFNFKIDNASDKRIGVVAQEIETVCPKLVEEVFDKDSDGNLLETSTKSVKYSVLYMKAIKALQEAQTRIETLETEVAALKAA